MPMSSRRGAAARVGLPGAPGRPHPDDDTSLSAGRQCLVSCRHKGERRRTRPAVPSRMTGKRAVSVPVTALGLPGGSTGCVEGGAA